MSSPCSDRPCSAVREVIGRYRSPDLHAVLYFAFFILTDPPTSPVKYPHQLLYGALVAVCSYAFFEIIGAVYYLLAAVLIGNLYEAGRRWYAMQQ